MKNFILLIVCLILSVTSIFIGVNNLNLAGIIQLDENQLHTLIHSRLPRLISIIIAGSSMAICGLIMQQLTRNKFVSPTTAGTMDSASLGIMVSMLMFASATMMQKMIVSFLFALAGTLIFMKILDRIKFKNIIFVPLVGLMFGNIVGSITTFFAYSNDLIQNISSWLQGSFALIITGRYEMLYVSIPLLIIAYIFANRFTIAGMGEEFSVNLGLNYKQVVNIGLIIVAAITSVVVLTVGMIPFLGLIIPNIVAIFQGDNLRKNLPTTALLGVAFVLACDIIGRVIIFPYQIPIGLTVGVIGSAIFLYLLIRGKKHGY
ncbi:ABC transporter permease [Alkalihalobacillus pseudalcaliphilus]|uniref:ABC transporter permease n=1 Tax=Alkalihalobacillus pseudalcaliphilus TaxID=79884 RepID=UPI00064E0B57|nr:ABC transporter permease [Alkalihalobacillus pseudalcaliphilus]KMK76019.1 iron ABC transporter permease [Alkalihalobacillus pseudalcaliphilus]